MKIRNRSIPICLIHHIFRICNECKKLTRAIQTNKILFLTLSIIKYSFFKFEKNNLNSFYLY